MPSLSRISGSTPLATTTAVSSSRENVWNGVDETVSNQSNHNMLPMDPKGNQINIKEDIVPNDGDFLMGREWSHHHGNKRLREHLGKYYRGQYQALKENVHKTELSKEIIAKVRRGGVRFLRRNEGTEKWEEVEDNRARKKVCEILREKDRVRQGTMRGQAQFEDAYANGGHSAPTNGGIEVLKAAIAKNVEKEAGIRAQEPCEEIEIDHPHPKPETASNANEADGHDFDELIEAIEGLPSDDDACDITELSPIPIGRTRVEGPEGEWPPIQQLFAPGGNNDTAQLKNSEEDSAKGDFQSNAAQTVNEGEEVIQSEKSITRQIEAFRDPSLSKGIESVRVQLLNSVREDTAKLLDAKDAACTAAITALKEDTSRELSQLSEKWSKLCSTHEAERKLAASNLSEIKDKLEAAATLVTLPEKAKEEFSEMSDEIFGLKVEGNEFEATTSNQHLAEKVTSLENANKDTAKLLEEKDAEITSAMSVVASIKKDALSTASQLTEQAAEAEDRVNVLEVKLERDQMMAAVKLKDTEEKLQVSIASNGEMAQQMASLKSTNENIRHIVSEKEAVLDALKEKTSSELSKLLSQKIAAEEWASSLGGKLETEQGGASAKLADMENKMDELTASNAQLTKQVSLLQNANDGAAKLLAEKDNALKEARSTIVSLTEEASQAKLQLSEEVTKLRKDKESAEERACFLEKSFKDQHGAFDKVKGDVDRLSAEKEDLQSDLADSRATRQSLQNAQDEKNNLSTQLVDLQSRYDSMQSSKSAQEEAHKELKANFLKLESSFLQRDEEITAYQKEASMLSSRRDELEERLKSLAAEMSSLKEDHSSAMEKVRSRMSELDSERVRAEVREKELLAENKNAMTILKQENDNLVRKLKSAEAERDECLNEELAINEEEKMLTRPTEQVGEAEDPNALQAKFTATKRKNTEEKLEASIAEKTRQGKAGILVENAKAVHASQENFKLDLNSGVTVEEPEDAGKELSHQHCCDFGELVKADRKQRHEQARKSCDRADPPKTSEVSFLQKRAAADGKCSNKIQEDRQTANKAKEAITEGKRSDCLRHSERGRRERNEIEAKARHGGDLAAERVLHEGCKRREGHKKEKSWAEGTKGGKHRDRQKDAEAAKERQRKKRRAKDDPKDCGNSHMSRKRHKPNNGADAGRQPVGRSDGLKPKRHQIKTTMADEPSGARSHAFLPGYRLGDEGQSGHFAPSAPHNEAAAEARSLQVGDAAFVLRSDHKWTYAVVAKRVAHEDGQTLLRFKVDESVDRKGFRESQWGKYVRVIKCDEGEMQRLRERALGVETASGAAEEGMPKDEALKEEAEEVIKDSKIGLEIIVDAGEKEIMDAQVGSLSGPDLKMGYSKQRKSDLGHKRQRHDGAVKQKTNRAKNHDGTSALEGGGTKVARDEGGGNADVLQDAQERHRRAIEPSVFKKAHRRRSEDVARGPSASKRKEKRPKSLGAADSRRGIRDKGDKSMRAKLDSSSSAAGNNESGHRSKRSKLKILVKSNKSAQAEPDSKGLRHTPATSEHKSKRTESDRTVASLNPKDVIVDESAHVAPVSVNRDKENMLPGTQSSCPTAKRRKHRRPTHSLDKSTRKALVAMENFEYK